MQEIVFLGDEDSVQNIYLKIIKEEKGFFICNINKLYRNIFKDIR